MHRHSLAVCLLLCVLGAARLAHADEIPIVTLTDVGPNQDIPTTRSFYVAGDAASSVLDAQTIIVRKGSPSLFGDNGPDCHALLADLRIEATSTSAADDDDDDDSDDSEGGTLLPRYGAGVHRVFEMFPRAEPGVREDAVLVSAAWERGTETTREYRMFVPHEADFFSPGYAYCMFVVTTERAQELDDTTLAERVDGVARKIVACGDRSSCDDDALADYEAHLEKDLASSRSIADGPAGEAKAIAARLKEAARAELASSTGIIEALDHMEDRWHDKTNVLTPSPRAVWAETAVDPFAQAVATMLARAGALVPQVRPDRKGTTVALYTTDGKLQVQAVQLLDDGRSIRVASSKAPKGDQARVLTATTDTLALGDGLTLYDLIELGQSRVHIDKDWVSLTVLGDRVAGLGLETWSADDAAYLVAATAHLKRLSELVGSLAAGATCTGKAYEPAEIEQSPDAVRRHLGEWLVCQHVDTGALDALYEQLADLVHEDLSWRATKDKLVARSKKLVTLTTTAPIATRVSFTARTWPFSYVTPIIGYAGVLRPEESFGLFYVGAQIHLDPNPVDDVLWRNGVTTKDLRRSVALELAVAPTGSSFGPEHRYSGPGGLPPIFFGVAIHVIPYTSFTFGGAVLDRKHSTLVEEQPHTIVSPYVGLTLQLNLPDLVYQVSRPGSDTTANR